MVNVIEARSVQQIRMIADRIQQSQPTADARKLIAMVAALDALAEDLCGRYAWDAVEIKVRIQIIVRTLCPGRELT